MSRWDAGARLDDRPVLRAARPDEWPECCGERMGIEAAKLTAHGLIERVIRFGCRTCGAVEVP